MFVSESSEIVYTAYTISSFVVDSVYLNGLVRSFGVLGVGNSGMTLGARGMLSAVIRAWGVPMGVRLGCKNRFVRRGEVS